MAAKTQKLHDRKLYYSMPAAARMLGTTTTKLKQIIESEGIEYCNFHVNGALWVNALDLANYLRRRDCGRTFLADCDGSAFLSARYSKPPAQKNDAVAIAKRQSRSNKPIFLS